MDNIVKKQGYDPESRVHQFLDGLKGFDERPPDEESIAARLCTCLLSVCPDIYQKFSRSKVLGEEYKRAVGISLQRSFDRLRLWSDDYGICAGEQDIKFKKSRRLEHATIDTLTSVGDTLLERLEPMTSSKKAETSNSAENSTKELRDVLGIAHSYLDYDTTSSDSDSNYDSDSFSEVAKDLETDTMCLMALDTLFQSVMPAPSLEKTTSAKETQIWLPHYVYKDKIQTRFPKAHSSLITKLSIASYDRFLRCQQQRQSQAEEVDKTEATVSGSVFLDSGLGTSISYPASVAETVMSYHADVGNSVRIPPLPKEAKEGKPFECVSCGKLLSIHTNSAWKRHLYQDLLPWQCLDLDCSLTTPFKTRDDWVAHIAHEHSLDPSWLSITCPLCLETTAQGKTAITQHLCNHLEEMSLAAIPTNQDLDSCSTSENDSLISENQNESRVELDHDFLEKMGALEKTKQKTLAVNYKYIEGLQTSQEMKEKFKTTVRRFVDKTWEMRKAMEDLGALRTEENPKG